MEWYFLLVVMLLMIFSVDRLVLNIMGVFHGLLYLLLTWVALVILIGPLQMNKWKEKTIKIPKKSKKVKKKAVVNDIHESIHEEVPFHSSSLYLDDLPDLIIPKAIAMNMGIIKSGQETKKKPLQSRSEFIEKNFSSRKSLSSTKTATEFTPLPLPEPIPSFEHHNPGPSSDIHAEPVQEENPELPTYDESDETRFVASSNGTKFHLENCMVAKRIPHQKRQIFTHPVDVLRKGYFPCGICNPLKQAS